MSIIVKNLLQKLRRVRGGERGIELHPGESDLLIGCLMNSYRGIDPMLEILYTQAEAAASQLRSPLYQTSSGDSPTSTSGPDYLGTYDPPAPQQLSDPLSEWLHLAAPVTWGADMLSEGHEAQNGEVPIHSAQEVWDNITEGGESSTTLLNVSQPESIGLPLPEGLWLSTGENAALTAEEEPITSPVPIVPSMTRDSQGFDPSQSPMLMSVPPNDEASGNGDSGGGESSSSVSPPIPLPLTPLGNGNTFLETSRNLNTKASNGIKHPSLRDEDEKSKSPKSRVTRKRGGRKANNPFVMYRTIAKPSRRGLPRVRAEERSSQAIPGYSVWELGPDAEPDGSQMDFAQEIPQDGLPHSPHTS